MKIAWIIIGIIVIVGLALESVGRAIGIKSRKRFEKMSERERRENQEQMYKLQQMG